MRLLDIFCGAGGAAMGYHEAGFDEVVGVDIKPQPHYPFEFIQADAIRYLEAGLDGPLLEEFDAIHASPPCQKWTAYGRRPNHVGEYDDLIGPTRKLLRAFTLPYVIENVAGAPLIRPTMLCGSSFGLDVRRHRFFETSFPLLAPPCDHGAQQPRFAPASNRKNLRKTVEVGVYRIPLEVQRKAMEIDWMTLGELSQAIPPAYTEYIGKQLLASFVKGAK